MASITYVEGSGTAVIAELKHWPPSERQKGNQVPPFLLAAGRPDQQDAFDCNPHRHCLTNEEQAREALAPFQSRLRGGSHRVDIMGDDAQPVSLGILQNVAICCMAKARMSCPHKFNQRLQTVAARQNVFIEVVVRQKTRRCRHCPIPRRWAIARRRATTGLATCSAAARSWCHTAFCRSR